MVWWIAKVKQSERSKGYFYVIVGSDDQVYFCSSQYDTAKLCQEKINKLQKSIKKHQDKYITIENRNEDFYFEVKAANYVSFGKSTIFHSEKECMDARDQFVEFMQKSDSIILDDNGVYIDELPIDCRIMDYMFSLDGKGFDREGNGIEENPTDVKQWEHPNSVLWGNEVIRENYLKVVLRLEGEDEK